MGNTWCLPLVSTNIPSTHGHTHFSILFKNYHYNISPFPFLPPTTFIHLLIPSQTHGLFSFHCWFISSIIHPHLSLIHIYLPIYPFFQIHTYNLCSPYSATCMHDLSTEYFILNKKSAAVFSLELKPHAVFVRSCLGSHVDETSWL